MYTLHTVFTWLNATPLIITTLYQCHNGFQSYENEHCLGVSSSDCILIVTASIFHTMGTNTMAFNQVNTIFV